jgi:membrane associated rhomboid family serine protease
VSDPAVPGRGSDEPSSWLNDVTRAGPLDADVAVGLLQRGQALADQGDWEIAASTFARVVGSTDPALHTAALLGVAECRYRLDDEPGALQAWISATQAPENPLTWRAWKALAAARVRADDVAGAARSYREAARRAPASEQAALQSRIGWLSKELGDDRSAQRAFGRSRSTELAQPVVTYGLLAVTVTVGFVTLDERSGIWALLALDKSAVYFSHEYWRLLTVVLVHGGLIHLLFNMYALWTIGPIVEALYGPWRYLGIYLLCGAAGSAASYATSPTLTVGASGAVFGLFGALVVADRVHKPALTRNARNLTMQIGVLIGINLLIGFSIPNIDNAAHVGGLLAGAWLGFVVVPKGARLASFWSRPRVTAPGGVGGPMVAGPVTTPEPDGRGRLLQVGGVLALAGVIVLVIAASPVTWHPRDLIFGTRQPAPVGEAVGDTVAIAARVARPVIAGPVVVSGVGGETRGGQGLGDGQSDDDGATGRAPGSPVAQGQAEPDGDALGLLEPAIDGTGGDDVGASERIAA